MESQTFLRLKDVMGRTGLCRSTIYQKVDAGEFPKPVKLSTQAVAWLESEIAAWQQERIAQRDASEAA